MRFFYEITRMKRGDETKAPFGMFINKSTVKTVEKT